MILSKSCIYGIQAAIYVAAQTQSASASTASASASASAASHSAAQPYAQVEFVSISTIADNLNISFHFLTKVLQQFTQSGIMLSYRGPHGGVALALPPKDITLQEMITAIDGPDLFTECLLGLPGCGKAEGCPVHESWTEIRSNLLSIASTTTLEELAARQSTMQTRLVANPAIALPRRTEKVTATRSGAGGVASQEAPEETAGQFAELE